MKCEICNDNKDYAKFPNHLRMKHNISEDEYNQQILNHTEKVFDDVNEIEVNSNIVTPAQVRENIFDGPKEWSLDMPLREYLDKKNLTLPELNSVVDRFIKGSAIDITYQMKRRQELGEKNAESLKDQEYVETPELLVAETLRTKYGFTVKSVSGVKPNKVWKLEKTK